MTSRTIFVTGGTGYIGRRLIPILIERGHAVRALVRSESQQKLPTGCTVISGDALSKDSFVNEIAPADTFVQLVGVAHPSPAKAVQFRTVDFASASASIAAAAEKGIGHFVYVSVAHPAPIMESYLQVRIDVEELIRASGLPATILRPLYVLGPGHWWPLIIAPAYWILERLPGTRASAQRLGLITLHEMVAALVNAIENPPDGVRILEVPEIRNIKLE